MALGTRRSGVSALVLLSLLLTGTHARVLLQDAAEPEDCCARLESIGWNGSLPVVIIDSTEAIPLTSTTVADICTCEDGVSASYRGDTGVRGNSSKKNAKKSYKINTIFENGTNHNTEFLGFPKENDWVLYGGDPVDLTLGFRNWVAYNMARATGQYASRTKWVEVFLVDGDEPLSLADYNGIYIAEEKVKRDNDRVDIKKWTPENPTGGYLFAMDNDNYDDTETLVGPIPGMEFPFVLKYPKNEPEAVTWLDNYLTEFHDALFSADWLRAYPPFVNQSTWVDYFLVVELSKNPDGYRGSTYMSKDRDGPINMGPVWDYNEAFGACCGFPIEGYEQNGASAPGIAGGSAISANGWRFLICADADRCVFDPDDGISEWYRRVWNDSDFRVAANARFAELRAGPWSDSAVNQLISVTADQIEPAILRDFENWGDFAFRDWYANPEVQFESEISSLQTWTLDRLAWMGAALERAASPAYRYPQDNQVPIPGSSGAASTAGRAVGRRAVQDDTKEETLSEAYSDTMQKRMGDAKLVYRHEDGMNYTRITEDIIVGSCPQSADDLRHLAEKEGVTVVLSLQEDTDMAYFNLDLAPILQACPAAGVTHLRCPIRDFDGHSLRLRLPTAVAALARAADRARGTLYFHCTAGLGRAPAVALAYLWWVRGVPLPEARRRLTALRPCSPRMAAIRAAALDLLQGLRARPVVLGLAGAGLASSVQVAGLDIGWGNRLDLAPVGRRWELRRDMLPGSYFYKFVMDGRWTKSPDHPQGFDGSNWNNVLNVQGWEKTPQEMAVRERVLGEEGDLTVQERRTILDYLASALAPLDEEASWPPIQRY